MRVLFCLSIYVPVLLSCLRQDQVKYDADNPRQSDAAEFDNSKIEAHTANAEDQDDCDNRQIARLHEICSSSDQGVDANDGNSTKKQNHDAAHNGDRYGIQKASKFADEGK